MESGCQYTSTVEKCTPGGIAIGDCDPLSVMINSGDWAADSTIAEYLPSNFASYRPDVELFLDTAYYESRADMMDETILDRL